MPSRPFYRRYGRAILLGAAALIPLIGWGVYEGVRSNSNDVRDWLPLKYAETQQYRWFQEPLRDERLHRGQLARLHPGRRSTGPIRPASDRAVRAGLGSSTHRGNPHGAIAVASADEPAGEPGQVPGDRTPARRRHRARRAANVRRGVPPGGDGRPARSRDRPDTPGGRSGGCPTGRGAARWDPRHQRRAEPGEHEFPGAAVQPVGLPGPADRVALLSRSPAHRTRPVRGRLQRGVEPGRHPHDRHAAERGRDHHGPAGLRHGRVGGDPSHELLPGCPRRGGSRQCGRSGGDARGRPAAARGGDHRASASCP